MATSCWPKHNQWLLSLMCCFLIASSDEMTSAVVAQSDVLEADADKFYPAESISIPRAAPLDLPGRRPLNDTGQIDKIVFLVRFQDHQDRDLPDRSVYDIILNKEGGHPIYAPGGSALDYGREVSYGQIDIVSHVIDWIELPETQAYYANSNSGLAGGQMGELVQHVINYAERQGLIDLTQFDNNGDSYVDLVTFIHSGYGAEAGGLDADRTPVSGRIWSHKSFIPLWTSPRSGLRVSDYAISSGLFGLRETAPCRLSLLAHEAAHLGDLMDLYDKAGTIGISAGFGIGAWGLMGAAQGFDRSGHYPPHLSAWSRVMTGWVTPKEINTSRVYTIRQIEEYPDVFRIDAGFPKGEYLLIENRQPTGFDKHLPGGTGGLAIWHIDENQKDNSNRGFPSQAGWPGNNKHYRVALLQADGRYDLERGINRGDRTDLFRAGHVATIDSDSVPGLRPYLSDPKLPRARHRISEISESGPVMTFRYDVELAGTSLAQSTDSASAAMLQPVRGAELTSAEFGPDDNKRLPAGGGILLQAQLNLVTACNVHIDATTSVTADVACQPFSTGLTGEAIARRRFWSDSVRLVSVPGGNNHVNVSLSSRQRLPAGQHTISWIFHAPDTALKFRGGGSLAIKAFPVESK